MTDRFMLLLAFLLTLLVLICCLASELSWTYKDQEAETLRGIIGLPSLAIGNLSPAARNPGLEMICTSLFDLPGGYCYYYEIGVPFEDNQYFGNITLKGND